MFTTYFYQIKYITNAETCTTFTSYEKYRFNLIKIGTIQLGLKSLSRQRLVKIISSIHLKTMSEEQHFANFNQKKLLDIAGKILRLAKKLVKNQQISSIQH